jgi:hypothetical protein
MQKEIESLQWIIGGGAQVTEVAVSSYSSRFLPKQSITKLLNSKLLRRDATLSRLDSGAKMLFGLQFELKSTLRIAVNCGANNIIPPSMEY